MSRRFAQRWTVGIERLDDGSWCVVTINSDATTGREELNYELYSSSSVLFQELLTALDASIFTFLATAEGVLPEGQLPLL